MVPDNDVSMNKMLKKIEGINKRSKKFADSMKIDTVPTEQQTVVKNFLSNNEDSFFPDSVLPVNTPNEVNNNEDEDDVNMSDENSIDEVYKKKKRVYVSFDDSQDLEINKQVSLDLYKRL